MNVSSSGTLQHFRWPFPQPVCTILCNHRLTGSVTGGFCTRFCCSQDAIKDPPPSSWDTRAHLERKISTSSRSEKHIHATTMDPCDCSKCKFSFCKVLVFGGNLLQFKTYELFSSWKMQLRRLLRLHKLLVHHMQKE